MTKKYRSGSSIAINVTLSSGERKHIAFSTDSSGSSAYVTSDTDVQDAIERHYRFGELFRLAESFDEVRKAREEEEERKKSEPEIQVIKVNDIGEAKDYLATTYSISRTVLRSQKNILDQAAAHGIEFRIGNE